MVISHRICRCGPDIPVAINMGDPPSSDHALLPVETIGKTRLLLKKAVERTDGKVQQLQTAEKSPENNKAQPAATLAKLKSDKISTG
jgi:hypothetical protein